MGSRKGKEVASGKRTADDEFKTGRYKRKRTDADRAVLQFFEDSAAEVDDDDGLSSCDSFFADDDFMEEVFDSGQNQNVKSNVSKVDNLPIFPKEEQFEEEFDKMMEERYKSGASFVRYAEDEFETKKFIEKDSRLQTTKDPIIWKVKCMVGRERYSAFCLMQKFVDLRSLGEKLKIVSAFAVDHVKGHIFIEADKQPEVHESCKGLCSIYTSRVVPVPRNEVSQLFSVRSRRGEVSEGMWCRIKSGNYKGDLAQIVAVNNEKRRATLKLIPRIDIQALAEKYGGGSVKRGRSSAAIPAPRLISSSELEEFRPLMQYRRDRETGKYFEILDGMMLKDGYLYKRAALDSLTLWGVVPSEEELLKFQPSDNGESGDLEWLSQLYGEQMKKRSMQYEKGGEKGEGSSKKEYNLYDLVGTGPKSFGLVVGVEKEDSFQILREGLGGQEVFSAGIYEITSGPIHAKFTAPDRQNKSISVNDTVRVLEGPLKDRQGIVKQIYRGVVFALDENEVENGGYFCFQAQLCEKVKFAEEILVGKDGETSFCGMDDLSSSPKSPLSPKKPWQARENRNDFNQGDRDGPYSIGQTLRIRVGPLKGYLCRVIAIRRSEVTVKLDSQQRVLTVKSEHLAELRGRSSALTTGDDQDDSSVKPFDLLGNAGGSTGWLGGSGTSASSGAWNTGSAASSSWPSFPSSGSVADPSSSAVNESAEETGWGKKAAKEPQSSWGTAASEDKMADKTDQTAAWGAGEDSWNKASSKGNPSSSTFGNWGKTVEQSQFSAELSKDNDSSWGLSTTKKSTERTAWDDSKEKAVPDYTGGKKADLSWDKGEEDTASGWNNSKNSNGDGNSSWNSWNRKDGGSTWTSNAGDSSNKNTSCQEIRKDANESWGSRSRHDSDKQVEGSGGKGETESAGDLKLDGGASWSKESRGSSWNKQYAGSSWSQLGGGNNKTEGSSWSKDKTLESATDGGSPWVKPTDAHKQDGAGSSWSKDGKESSWNKQDASSSWGQQKGGNEEQRSSSWAKEGTHGGSSWNSQNAAPDGAASSWGKGGTDSWNKQNANSSWGQSGGGSDQHKDSFRAKDGILGSGPSSWNKQNVSQKEDGAFSCWGKDKQGTWGGTEEGNSSDVPQSFGRGRGSRDWGGERTYDGGRGSGGRRGRGGPGGRGRFGRGRWSGQDQPSGWKDGGETNTTTGNDGWKPTSQSPGSWGSWGKDKDSSDGRGSAWGKGTSESAGWGKGGSDTQNAGQSWSNPNSSGVEGKSSWANRDSGGSSGSKQEGSSWKDGAGAGSSWGKSDQGASWGKQTGGSWSDGGERTENAKSSGAKPQESEDKANNVDFKGGFGGQDRSDSWSKPKSSDGGGGWSSNNNAGNTSNSWSKPKPSEGGGGGGGWSSNNNAGNASDSWSKPKPSEGGGLSSSNNDGNASDSWSKPKPSEGGGGWSSNNSASNTESNKWNCGNSSDGGNASWVKKDGSGDNAWNKGTSVVEDSSANLSKQKSESATGPSAGDAAPWKKEQDWGNNQSSWKKSETSWGTVTQGGSSAQDQTDSWSQQKSSVGNGGLWNKNGGGGGDSWNNKKDGESSWGSKSGGSSRGGQEGSSDGGGGGKSERSGGWGGGSGPGGWGKSENTGGWGGGSGGSDSGGWGKSENTGSWGVGSGRGCGREGGGRGGWSGGSGRGGGRGEGDRGGWSGGSGREGGDRGGWSGGRKGRGGRDFGGGGGGGRSWGQP